ncbi:MAG: acetate--CoA ligase family protein, partial [Pseudomonadota bacterium]
ILPVAAEEAEAALRSLRLAPLLDGWRGRPKADVAAAARAAAAISAFALAHADRLEELDVTPLIVAPHGAWAADALIRMREA